MMKPKPTSIIFSSKKEQELVRRAAKRQGKSVTQFLRELAVEKSRELLGEQPCPHCGAPAHAA
jgi:uncharacterized protein (DUF1778 family)